MRFKPGDKVCCPRWGYGDADSPGRVALILYSPGLVRPYGVVWPDGDTRWHSERELVLVERCVAQEDA